MLVEPSYSSRLFFSSSAQPFEQERLRFVVNCVALAVLFTLVVYQVWDWCFPGRWVEQKDDFDLLESSDSESLDGESHEETVGQSGCKSQLTQSNLIRQGAGKEDSTGSLGNLVTGIDIDDWLAGVEARKNFVYKNKSQLS